ncbi:MAG: hypothetical protein MJ057_07635 [Sphaerochaetaceae bacterium]|nr:hypothetical protein [Sphaerochaetaceae bacterium]
MKKIISALVALLIASSVFAAVLPVVNIKPYFTFDNSPSGIALGSTNWKNTTGLVNSNWWETRQDYWNRAFEKEGFADFGFVLDTDQVDIVAIVDLMQDSFMQFTNEGSILTNLPFLNQASIDLTFPRIGYVDYTSSNEAFYLSIGRRQVKWGPSTYDMAISDSPPFLDNLYASYSSDFGDNWNFTYSFLGIAYKYYLDVGVPAEGAPRSTFAHRFIFQNPSLRLSFAELNNIYGKQASLLDFTPIALWHDNFQDDCSNVMINVAAEAKLADFRLFGTFTMDDFEMGTETGSANRKPTALGFTAGIEWHLFDARPTTSSKFSYRDYALKEETFKKEAGMNISYEYFLCTTFMYNRAPGGGKFTSPFQFNSIAGYVDKFYDNDAFYLGFPYGPNTEVHRVAMEYDEYPLKAGFVAELIRRGSYYIDSTYNTAFFNSNDWLNAVKLSGVVTTALKLKFNLALQLQDAIRIDGSVGYTRDITHSTQSFQVTLGTSIDVCHVKL